MKANRSIALSPQPVPSAPRPAPKQERPKGDCGCGCGGHKKSGGSGCGCGGDCHCGCEPVCCRLECVERPSFFCGQLLTDQDLDTLVGWTRQRLALSRYVDGWGVACGLDVTCAGAATVAVTPGYAVDCCGNDIVVCEPNTIDLAAACGDPGDPCGDLYAWTRTRKEPEKGDERQRFQVDVGIRYRETGSDPQSALAQGPCGQVASCENTRIQEGGELFWTAADPDTSPADAAAAAWKRAWDCCCEVVEQFEKRFGGAFSGPAGGGWRQDVQALQRQIADLREKAKAAQEEGAPRQEQEAIAARIRELEAALAELEGRHDGPGSAGGTRLAAGVRRFLLQWLEDHPPTQLCLLKDWICEHDDESFADADTVFPLLYLIVQDCRNALARCACPPCAVGDGVALARVCLELGGPKQQCRVVSIDPYPPYRRELATDCWPAPLGRINLARVLWHRHGDACLKLSDLGLEVRAPAQPRRMPTSLEELYALCKMSPFGRCGEPVCLGTLDASELCLGDEPRVIGFSPCPADPPPPEPDPEPDARPVNIDPRKSGPQEVFSSRGQIDYRVGFACGNPNPFPVTLHFADRLPAPLDYAGDDAGVPAQVSGRTVRWSFPIPAATHVDKDWGLVAKFQPVRQSVTVENHAILGAEAPDGTALGEARVGPFETRIVAIVGDPIPGDPTDDLTEIQGIAAARERALVEHGIDSFAKLGAAKMETLTTVFPKVAERFLAQWRDQAQELAQLTPPASPKGKRS